VGQKHFIPGENTAGYATPTPVGMVVVNDAGADGKIIHAVQPYQTLITIAQAYHVSVDTLLAQNGWQKDWPLQIGQKLFIGSSTGIKGSAQGEAAPSPIQQLTPADDGRYYHRVKSGETLSSIADQYQSKVQDLMAWNGLDGASILYPDQKLVLQVTPPATPTLPPTPTHTAAPPAQAAGLAQALTSVTPPDSAVPQAAAKAMNGEAIFKIVVLLMFVGGAALTVMSMRKRA
jgi:LysM repeat protein